MTPKTGTVVLFARATNKVALLFVLLVVFVAKNVLLGAFAGVVVVAIEVLRKVPSVKFMLGIFDVVVSGLALKVPVAVVAVDAVVVVVVDSVVVVVDDAVVVVVVIVDCGGGWHFTSPAIMTAVRTKYPSNLR